MRGDHMKKIAIILGMLVLILGVIVYAVKPSGNGPVDEPLSQTLIDSGIKIIDIRTAPEWEMTGIVKGAYPITFFDERGGYNISEFTSQLDNIVSKDEKFAIVCRTGNRTSMAVKILREQGYKNVIDVLGGVKAGMQNGITLVPYVPAN